MEFSLFYLWFIAYSAFSPESRALAFLSIQVPRWSRENHCFSCHNNGDAARALFTAVRLGRRIPGLALEDTTAWLRQPERWDHSGGEGAASDIGLARIQFAAALIAAQDARLLKSPASLKKAAELVALGQQADGSWQVDAGGAIGSPATYGPFLATVMAASTLRRADEPRYAAALERSRTWLRGHTAETILDAAAVMLGLANDRSAEARGQRERAFHVLRGGQGANGGWGPYVRSSAEVFDTALALLALRTLPADKSSAMIAKGREYLIRTQEPDGGWPATTRPAGGTSYAQRLSTTGWATQALLLTASDRRP